MTDDIINLGLGRPSLSLLPLSDIERSINRVFHKKDASFLQYGPVVGDEYSRLILARFLSEMYEKCVTPECFSITNGISQGIDLACTLFTGRHDTIFVEEPTYNYALDIFKDHHLNVIEIPVDADGIIIKSLKEMLRVYNPAFLYMIPAFHNPTSVCLAKDRKEKLISLSKKHNFYILSDEAYQLLNFNSQALLPFACSEGSENILSFGSFSKICAPGLRLGWVQAQPFILNRFSQAGVVQSSGCLNPFAAGIITSFIESGYQKKNLVKLKAEYKKRAFSLYEALEKFLKDKARFSKTSGGFFIWVTLDEDADTEELLEKAREKGVLFQPGSKFSHRGKFKNCLRLCFSYYDEEKLVEGVRRLSEVV